MYKIIAIALCVLLVGCSGTNPVAEFDKQTNVAGQVISDVFNPTYCMTDSRCPIGYRCVDNLCEPKES